MAEQFEIGPETTFGELVRHKAESVGDQVFLTYIRDFDLGVEEKYTYRDMHLQSNRLGNGLKRLGLEQGDGISLIEINSPEFLFTLFAAVKLGAYTVLVNIGLKGESLQYIIDHSDSKAVVIHWTLLDNYRAISDQLPKVEHVIVDVNEAPRDHRLPEGMISQKTCRCSSIPRERPVSPRPPRFSTQEPSWVSPSTRRPSSPT